MAAINVEKELLKLEKIVQKIIRTSIRDSGSDYHVQIGVSSLDPGRVKYSLNIQNIDGNFAPITLVLNTLDDLKNGAKELEKRIDRDMLERAFIKSRIDIFERQLAGAKESLAELEEIGYEAMVEKRTEEFKNRYKEETSEDAEK